MSGGGCAQGVPTITKKPVMRYMCNADIKAKAAPVVIMCTIVGIAWTLFVKNARKAAYLQYYKDYDMQEHSDEMAKKRLFQAVPNPDKD